jgi:diguanylate cyclase (GGDEF)-like protein
MLTDTPTVALTCARDRCDRAMVYLMVDIDLSKQMAEAVLQGPAPDADVVAQAQLVLAMAAVRQGDLALARQWLVRARSEAGAAGGSARIQCLLQQVDCDLLRSQGLWTQALEGTRALHDRAHERPLIDAYLSAGALALTLSMKKLPEEALDLAYQALSLARRSGHDELVTTALNNLGHCQTNLFNMEDALPLLEECLNSALRLGHRRRIIFGAHNLVRCLTAMGRAEAALQVMRTHLQALIRPDDPPMLRRLESVATVLVDNGLFDEAEAALREIPDPSTLHMDHERITVRVVVEARLLLARGQADQALKVAMARRAHIAAQGEEGPPTMLDKLNLLRISAQAARSAGQPELAYDLLSEAYDVHDALAGSTARARQVTLQVVHRLKEAESERDTAQQFANGLSSLTESLQAQIAENERLQERLLAQAREDTLTGLPNRRHLQEAGPKLKTATARRGEPLAVAIVDLDHFKRINDNHGHDTGDRVLCAFAQIVQTQVRADDLVARYGGEEFVLLLAGAHLKQARRRLIGLIEDFLATPMTGAQGEVLHCSFSAGLTLWEEGERLEQVISRADQALYQAKHAGRARVCSLTAHPGEPD